MGITPSTLSSPLTAAAYQAEVDRVRNWLNGGIVAGDIGSAVIAPIHMYRPDVFGYPKRGVEGISQSLAFALKGIDSPPTRPGSVDSTNARARHWIATNSERETIRSSGTSGEEGYRSGIAAKRVTLHETSLVNISAEWEAVVLTSIVSGSLYPDYHGGEFSIRYQEASATGAETKLHGLDWQAPAAYAETTTPAHIRANHFTGGGQVSLAAGVWDFWLHYDGAGGVAVQVDLGVTNFIVEVQR